MKKEDPILADELNRRITAEMQGKNQPPVSEAIQPEAELAKKLIALANDTHPDADFVANLGSRLARKAREKSILQRKNVLPEQRSFWQQLIQNVKEGTTMNRNKYLLGTLGALVLIVAGAFIFMNRDNGNQTEPPIAVVESEEQLNEDSTNADDQNDSAASDDAPETDDPEVVEVAELPLLPQLDSGQAIGAGGEGAANVRPQSGGGGFATESASLDFDTSLVWTDPFSGTTFILNATLPTGESLATVVKNQPEDVVSVETAQALAAQFGFSAELYTERYPVFEGEEAFVPPIVYHAFDGRRNLIIDPWGVYYNDQSIQVDYQNTLPFEQASPIAEAFLNERGLLNFPYEIQQIWGNDVNFVRLIDGEPANQPEIVVGVNQDGQVHFVSYQVLRNAETVGRYPLITAEAAWEILQSGVVENNIPYTFGIGPEFAVAEPAIEELEDPFADLYQFWMREYAPGDEVHLYEWPIVYEPVSGAEPRVLVRNYRVQADAATLNAIAEQVGQQVHLWGTVGAEGNTIELAGWEALEQFTNPISAPGTISRTGDEVLFTSDENGSVYIVPDAPADLEDGLAVYLFAWAARDLGQEFPVLDWENIDKIVEFPEEPIREEPIVIEEPGIGEDAIFEPFTYESFAVNEVSLAYYTTYIWPTDESGNRVDVGQPTVIVQPTWKFSGETDTGEFIEFFVQAVAADYLDR